MNADGIPTPNGAARWLHTSIRQIAHHPGYAGVAVANTYKVEKVDGKHRRTERPASEHVLLPEGTIPPLVTPEQAAAIRLRAAQNKTEAKRTNRDPESFLLRAGLVRCGHCGRTVHAAWRRNGRGEHRGRPIYEVLRRSTEHYDCPNASISARKLDADVWQFATNIMLHPTLIVKRIAALKAQGGATAAELASIDRSIVRVEKQQANLARALAHFDDDETAAPTRAQMKALGQERKELQAERAKVAAQHEAWEREEAATRAIVEEMRELQRGIVTDEASASVRELGAVAMTKLRHMSYDEKRERLRRLGVTVYLYPDAAPNRFIVKTSHAAQTVDTSA